MTGFCSHTDSSANTAALRPDMHCYSGQMSAFCGLQDERVRLEKKGRCVPWSEQKNAKDIQEFGFSPAGTSTGSRWTFLSLGASRFDRRLVQTH